MKTRRLFYYVLCLFIMLSCSERRHEGAVAIPLDSKGKLLEIGEVIDIVDWTELKADSGSYISNATKIEMFASEYYILDPVGQKCVMRYSADGQLMNKIGRTGSGPGEYSLIIDFTIDWKNRKVIILSDQSAVFVYNFDGIFERKEKLTEGYLSKISSNKNGLMASTNFSSALADKDEYLLYEFDSDLQCIGEWIPYKQPLQLIPMAGSNFATVGNLTYYADNIGRRLLAYDSDSNAVDTVFSFELKNPMPEEIYADPMKFMEEQRNYNWLSNYVFTSSKIVACYICEGKYSVAVIDGNGKILNEGIFNGPFPDVSYDVGDTVYSALSVDMVSHYLDKKDIRKPSFEISDSTNMLIMKWKIK